MANQTISATLLDGTDAFPSLVVAFGRDGNGVLRPLATGTDGQLTLNLTGEGLALDVSVDALEGNTQNAASTFRLLSAAGTSDDENAVKASAGVVYSIQGANVASSARYLKLYDKASASGTGDTPRKTIYLPPLSAFDLSFPHGLAFTTGIRMRLVTGSADNDGTDVTAGDILALNVDYT